MGGDSLRQGGHWMSSPSGPARSRTAYRLSSMSQCVCSGADPVCWLVYAHSATWSCSAGHTRTHFGLLLAAVCCLCLRAYVLRLLSLKPENGLAHAQEMTGWSCLACARTCGASSCRSCTRSPRPRRPRRRRCAAACAQATPPCLKYWTAKRAQVAGAQPVAAHTAVHSKVLEDNCVKRLCYLLIQDAVCGAVLQSERDGHLGPHGVSDPHRLPLDVSHLAVAYRPC